MKKNLILIMFIGSVLSASFATAQTSMSSDEMLRSNEQVMDALMLRIKRDDKLSERQNLIVEHMKLMDIYLSSVEKRILSENDHDHKALLKETYRLGLKRSLILIESGIANTDIIMMGITTDEHLLFIEQRMTVLQSLMKQLANAKNVLNN